MEHDITAAEARFALNAIEHRQNQVLAEIDVPWLYWVSMAAGWVGLGFISDLNSTWVTASSTLAFGAAHAAIAPRFISGRNRTRGLSVRADVANPHISALVLAFLVMMVGLTVGLGVAAHADGARHAGTAASLVVAMLVLLGGPSLMAAIRRRSTARGLTA